MAYIKIYSDVDGELFVDFKSVTKVDKHSFQSHQIECGQYFVRFLTRNSLLYMEKVISIDKDTALWIRKEDLLNTLSDTQINAMTIVRKRQGKNSWIEDLISGLQLSDNYDRIGLFHDGICDVWKNKHCGLINRRGEEIVECKYDDFGTSKHMISSMKINHKWGAVNSYGDFVIPAQYDLCRPRKDDDYWDISNDGKEECDLYGTWYRDGKWGICDQNGREVIPCKFKQPLRKIGQYFVADQLTNHITVFSLNGSKLFSDIEFQDLRLIEKQSSLFWMKKDSKWGIIGIDGLFIVANDYDDFREFYPNIYLGC